MDLLITPKLVSSYIKSLNKINKNDAEKIIHLFFDNENNNFIVNKKLLELYESEFSPDSYEFVKFQDEMVHLLNGRGINKGTQKINLDEVLQDSEKKYLAEKTCNEIYMNLSDNAANSLKNEFSAVLDNLSDKKSKDYTFFYLAAYNPISLTKRFYDFDTDDDIKLFLEDIYKLRTKNKITIFDKNINLTHRYYDFFKNKGLAFDYYTLKHRSFDIVERSNQYRILRDFFNRCAVYVYRAPVSNIHERRVMFNNLIIEFDNDPANILVSEPNWKIDIFVCNTIKSEIDNKGRRLFQRDTTT
ncbi:hypothetical protein [Flavobacterium sp. HJSW_4]|uniref:hypothetical protein n=1 Tax=Flavobacterium sp. HJSW_4 TaxID=3344660 RepID=UPI0035F420E8